MQIGDNRARWVGAGEWSSRTWPSFSEARDTPLTNGSGSRRPKNTWIRWIRIRIPIRICNTTYWLSRSSLNVLQSVANVQENGPGKVTTTRQRHVTHLHHLQLQLGQAQVSGSYALQQSCGSETFCTDPDPRTVQLANGSGSGSCSFRQWPSRWHKIVLLITFWRYIFHLHPDSAKSLDQEHCFRAWDSASNSGHILDFFIIFFNLCDLGSKIQAFAGLPCNM